MKNNTLQEFVRRSGHTLFLLVMIALLAPARVWGQETVTVTIGTSTSTTYNCPISMMYNYSLTEQIYTPAEIGYVGTINSIAFYYDPTSTPSFTINNVMLFMKNVTRASFADNTDMEPLTSDDLVWTGTFSASESGWITIILDTPFEYDGASNLLVATFDGSDGAPGGSNRFRYSSCDGYKMIRWYNDGASPDPYNTASGFGDHRNYSAYRNNIQLAILPSTTPKPVRLAVSNLFGHIATISWETLNENVITYQYQYKADDDEAWSDLTSTNNLSVGLEGLDPETTYTFRVKAIYPYNEESNFATTTFTTTEACISPIDLHATLTLGDGTVATLSWTEVGLANEWVLEYGTDADFVGATSVTVNDTTFLSLTGLTAETKHYARVKAVCGGIDGESLWSDVLEFTPTFAVPFTVCDGTNTCSYVPMYGDYFHFYTKSECVMPANQLVGMDDCQITSITFYPYAVGINSWDNTVQRVFLKEVDLPILANHFNGLTDGTIVFEGNLPSPAPSDESYTITFTEPYTYHGGNLLIGVYNTQRGSNNGIYWYGIQNDGLWDVAGYGASGVDLNSTVYYNQINFLPKTTFSYIPNSMGRPRNLTASNIAIHSATLSWTPANENVQGYQYRYLPEGGVWTEWTSWETPSVDLEGLDAETEYTFQVKAIYADGESNIASTTFTPTPNMRLTVNDGTTTSAYYIPIYASKYANYAKNESIFSANKLTGMDGATISAITFYPTKLESSGSWNNNCQVFVKEVPYSSLSQNSSSFSGMEGATVVYEGLLPEPTYASLDDYTIPFSQEFTYHGGNLLIGIYNTALGNNKSVYWYYASESTNGVSAYGYNSSSLESVSYNSSSYLPRTTFTYVFKNPWNLQASNYTVDGATLTWNAPRVDYQRCEYQYQAEGSEEWTDLVSTNETSVALTGLTSETKYVFRVRAVYEGEVAGDFVSVTFQLPVIIDAAHPFADGFEEGNKWILINGTETNQWMIGTATYLASTKSLYISNDGQNYSYSNNNSHVFATKIFHLAAGTYEVGYDWKNKGCSQDLVRVVLAPESATFVGGQTAVEYIQSSECIPLDNEGALHDKAYWSNYNTQFEIEEEGEYKMVFYWYNNNGYAYTPPAAIDNFYLKMYFGEAPENLTVTNITAHTADLNWQESGTATAWQVKYYTYAEYDASGYNVEDENYGHIVDAATNTNFTLSGLDPDTYYYIFVRSCYTVDGLTGYTDWSSSYNFTTEVSCFPVTNLHPTELGATTATLAWSTDTRQEAGNAPTSWNVRYATAPAVTYDFESESGIPNYHSDNETDWTVEEDATNAHSDSHCLESHNSDYNTYLYIPAYGGAVASLWVKNLDTNNDVYIWAYYESNYNGGGGDEPYKGYKGRKDRENRNTYLGWYHVAPDTLQKITFDLADFQGEGTLELQVSGMVAIDDITVNVLATTVTQQTLDFNQGSIGNYAQYWDGWSLVVDGDDGYIMSEANYEDAYVDFPIQLGSQISFRVKALVDENETIQYYLYVWNDNVGLIALDSIMVTDAFEDYSLDLSEYSGMAYLEFYTYDQPSLVVDDLSIPLVEMYNTLTVNGEPTLQMTDLEQMAVYEVGVQAHCGEDDDSYWEEISFVPAMCESENQCMITYEWNVPNYESTTNFTIVHHETGLRIATLYFQSGTSGTNYLSLCDNETYDIKYSDIKGKGSDDFTFTFYTPGGEVIANEMQAPFSADDGILARFTMDCNVCQWPQYLKATNLTTESAQLTWEQGGDVTSWLVSYRETESDSLAVALNESNWTALPQGWTSLTFDNDYNLVAFDDWTPANGALVSDTMSFLFIPVPLGGQAVVTTHGSEDENLRVGVYQGSSLIGLNENYLPYSQYSLTETAQSFTVDLSDYQGNGYLFLYHGCGDEPANLYLDSLKVYELAWSEGVIVNTTPSYTLTGLTAGTSYQARVQAVCGVNEYGNPKKVSFSTPFCDPASQCELTFVLTDSYGDSWNGNAINVVDVETDAVLATLANQDLDGTSGEETQTVTLAVCDGREIRFEWVYGSYVGECFYTVTDIYGDTIFSGSGALSDAVTYMVICSTDQTVALLSGWNWWAPTAAGTVEDVQLGLGSNYVDIIAQNVELEPTDNLVPGQMYKVKVNEDCTLSLEGEPFTTATVNIAQGYNWFGFIGSETTVTAAFADFGPVAGDKVISQNEGFAIFNGTEWVGTLTSLVPGKGYVYVSQDTESKTLLLGQ